jgi:hypothetical protein
MRRCCRRHRLRIGRESRRRRGVGVQWPLRQQKQRVLTADLLRLYGVPEFTQVGPTIALLRADRGDAGAGRQVLRAHEMRDAFGGRRRVGGHRSGISGHGRNRSGSGGNGGGRSHSGSRGSRCRSGRGRRRTGEDRCDQRWRRRRGGNARISMGRRRPRKQCGEPQAGGSHRRRLHLDVKYHVSPLPNADPNPVY